jgi:arylsulfatase A-like enzyme
LREYDPAKGPFYLNAFSQDVHAPWDRPEFQGRYNPDEITPPPYIPNTRHFRASLAQFYGAISFMDEQFGRILDCLRETGLESSTLISFTTDHGVSFPRCKSTLYDVGLSTALILRWPGHLPAGATCDQMLSNIDLLPSYLELAGITPSPGIQGRSFVAALTGGDYKPHDAIFAERNFHDDYDPMRSVRTDRYKYIRNFSLRPRPKLPSEVTEEDNELAVWNSGQPRPMEELYDLQQDPYEFTNLADRPEYAEILTQLRRRLDDWMQETSDYMRAAKECILWPSDDKRLLPLPAGAAPKPPARQPARQPAKPAPPPQPQVAPPAAPLAG